jgi:polar amino acid transport system substrate-binding protein
MRRLLRRSAIGALAYVCAAGVSARPRLTIITESSPPSAMMGDTQVIDYTIEIMPWKRAYLLAQSQSATCVYSTTRVPQREAAAIERKYHYAGPGTRR